MLTTPTDSIALRPREIAKLLGISQRTLWSLSFPRGDIPCARIGHGKRKSVLYSIVHDQAWLADQTQASKGDA